jgi:hypothetical protein
MASEWVDDTRRSELWQLIDMVGQVEEVPMYLIEQLCREHVIDHSNFSRLWQALCDAGHRVIEQAEDRMEAGYEYE